MIVGDVPSYHCNQFMGWWASFLRHRGKPDQCVGNTAQCKVCGRWFAYVWKTEGRYYFAEGTDRTGVIARLGGSLG